jgi:transketolase
MSSGASALTTPTRRRLANAIRFLAMDAVQAARSGHPGMPMGMADIAEVLWNDYLRFSPNDPQWPNRDRFVLSNGHGSMLLYAVAWLTGYPITLEELRNFRQLGSRTAGHPERELEIGVETTTGPLGQGIANAVGIALAEKVLGAHFNRPGHSIIDHDTYVFLGDGCMMEGVSHEACSLAGTLQLGKLIALYDDNGISIDGPVEGWFTDDTVGRFKAYGWHVIPDVDGHDAAAVAAAVEQARAETARPTLICCKTVIGYGAPNKKGTAATHGAPLGDDEIAAARAELDWPYAPFEVPEEIRTAWDGRSRGAALVAEWNDAFAAYRSAYPELAAEFERRMSGGLPQDWAAQAQGVIDAIAAEAKTVATRKASERALEGFLPLLPELVGGSADLTGSNNTKIGQSVVASGSEPDGNYFYFGVREFGMAAIMNGMALHGGLIPYGGTFLVFSDYARNALRMAALMSLRSILVLTHDSIGLGEDGPTHQPIEHIASLRAMPNMHVWRPCDTVETAVAWRCALERADGPSALVLSRQNLPFCERTGEQTDLVSRGGYILSNSTGQPELILIATGSEVALVREAAEKLEAEGRQVRVVSMPCADVFAAQDEAYQSHVLPAGVPRLAVEAGSTDSWWRFIGGNGDVIGMDSFGASAPGPELFEHFGFTVDNVIDTARRLI